MITGYTICRNLTILAREALVCRGWRGGASLTLCSGVSLGRGGGEGETF